MTKPQWIKAIEHWRSLPQEERRRRHLQAIPRHVANSMAMAEDAVDEDWIREQRAHHMRSSSAIETTYGFQSYTAQCSRSCEEDD